MTMTSDAATPIGWRVRIAMLWVAAVLIAVVAVLLLYNFGLAAVDVNAAYASSNLSDADIQAINDRWVTAQLLTGTATPLLAAALLIAVLTLAVQAWGWQLRRARGSAPLAGPPAP